MTLSACGLVTAVALSLVATSLCDAYVVRTGEVYEVPEADRLSAKHLFARDADLVSNGLDYINLRIDIPGRVYIRHIENETAVAAGLFGKLRASGDTRGAVEYIAFPPSLEYQSTNVFDEFMVSDARIRHNTSKSESLLLDVELYVKNTLKKLRTHGSADVVILQDVVYAAEDGKLIPDGTELEVSMSRHYNLNQAGPGNLFVSDPKAAWSGSSLSVVTAPNAGGHTVQIDVVSLNSTQEELWVYTQSNSNVTIFASEYLSPTFMIVFDLETMGHNPLCVAAKNDVSLITGGVMKGSNKTSTIPGGSMCVKLPLPPREPSLIRDEINGESAYLNAAKTATPAPSSSASQRASCIGLTLMLMLLSTLLA